MDQAIDTEWRWRTPMLAALGFLAGVAAWLLIAQTSQITPVKAALLSFVVIGAMTFGFVVERHRITPSALFALACALVAALIVYWNGPANSWSASEGWRLVALGLSLGIAAPLFQAWDGTRPVRCDYVGVHDHAWTNAVLFAASWAFVAIVILMTLMLSGLFDLIGIKWIDWLMKTDWFPRVLVGTAFGTGLGLLREQGKVVGLLQRVVMIVLGVLAPVLALGLVVFLIALPFTGFDALWNGWASAAALMLGCMVAAIILANAVIGNRPADEARNPALRVGAMVLAVVMLPLAVLASIAIGMRIGQYGFTPDRLWALTFAIIASAYGVAYFGSVLLAKQRWAARVRPANLKLAIGTCVVALILATPLPSFNAISTRDQVARLESGRTPVEQFDWAALAFDFGRPGRAALDRLAQSGDEAVRTGANRAVKAENRWDVSPDSPWARARAVAQRPLRVLPDQVTLPGGLLESFYNLQSEPDRSVILYRAGEDVAVLVTRTCEGCPVSTQVARRAQDGTWSQVAPGVGAASRDDGPAAGQALARGEVEIRDVTRRQVFLGDRPVGDVFE